MASRPPEDKPTGRMEPTPPTSQERGRFVVLNAVRVTGVILFVLGLALTQDGIDLAGELNHFIGYIFVIVGLAEMLVMPQILARRWRTPIE